MHDHALFFTLRFTDQQLWSLGGCLGTVLPLPSPDWDLCSNQTPRQFRGTGKLGRCEPHLEIIEEKESPSW